MGYYAKIRQQCESAVEQLARIYKRAGETHLPAVELWDQVREIRYSEPASKLPRWATEWIAGADYVLRKQYERNIVHAYYLDGQWLPIDCDDYRDYSPEYVCKYGIGAQVYRDNPSRLYWPDNLATALDNTSEYTKKHLAELATQLETEKAK